MDVQQLIYNYLPQKFLAHLHKSYYLSLSLSLSLWDTTKFFIWKQDSPIILNITIIRRLGIQVYLFETLNRKNLKAKNYLEKENRYLRRKSKTLSKSQFSKKFLDLIKNNNTIVNISGYQTLKLIYLLE